MPKKLVDDCFLHDSDRMRHDEVVTLLRDRIVPVTAAEKVVLTQAIGRTLAGGAVARQPVPGHTNAAVDGYAFAHADHAAGGGLTLPVSARVSAGHPLREPVAAGTAVRIFTGAVMPAGLDTTAMQEDCEVLDGGARVHVPAGLKKGANVRRAGEDVAQGETLLDAGHIVRPQDLAALASIGLGDVECRKRLKVAIVSTGDEVIRPGSRPLAPGEVYDANAPMLAAMAGLAGCDVHDLGVWPDRADEVRARLVDAAASHDVILTSGGASKGEEDHMVTALEALGKRHVWQLAIKPGRPMMFGQIGDTIMVGLPGNPVAVFVCFLLYVYPMLRRLGGAEWPEPRRLMLPAAFDFPKRKTGRREFWRGMLAQGPQGFTVDKYARDGSGLISGLRAADGLIDIVEDVPEVKRGDLVPFIPFTEFGILGR